MVCKNTFMNFMQLNVWGPENSGKKHCTVFANLSNTALRVYCLCIIPHAALYVNGDTENAGPENAAPEIVIDSALQTNGAQTIKRH